MLSSVPNSKNGFDVRRLIGVVCTVLMTSVHSVGVLTAGEIKGTVFDASTGQPLSGVNIYFLPERVRASTSNTEGQYAIEGLSAGSYQLMASYIGYNIQVKEIEVGDIGAVTEDFEIILSSLDVETSVVAASKREQTLIEAPTSVAVVFNQDVAEADEATTLAEVLKYVPGIDYAKAFEGHYNITTRGFNSALNNTMLLLIDGRTLNTPQTNHVNWAGVSLSEHEIDRIEVIKGPGSALYGANALSGVINIVTKSPRDMVGTTVSVSAGSRGTFSGSFTNAGVRGDLAYKVSGAYFENDDFLNRALVDTISGLRPTPENFRISKVDARLEYDLADKTQLISSGGFVTQRNLKLVASSASVNSEKENDFYVFGKLRHKDFTLRSYYNAVRTDTIRGIGVNTVTVANYDVFRFDAQQSLDLGKRSKLIFGAEYQWQHFDSKGILIPDPVTQNLFGLYGQYEGRLRSNLSLILTGRVDHHPTVDFQISPKAGLIYTLSNAQSLRFTVNQAYVNPIFIEQFIDFSLEFIPGVVLGIRGNRKLNPRKITAFEFGYQGFFKKKLKINLDLYHYELKDFISSPRVINFSDPSAVSHFNFGKINTNGIDFGLLYLISQGLRWNFNISLFEPNRSPVISEVPEENIPALNAPELKFSSTLRYETPQGLYGSASVRFVDEFDWSEEVFDPVPQTLLTTIDSYFIPDKTAGFRSPNKDFRIAITVSNLFDKKHQEIPKGSFIGRKIIGSLTTHF